MTSKEALQEMLGLTTTHYDYWLKANDYYELIKKDLDQLEKINEVWHKNEPMESVDINGNHLQEVYDFIHRLCEENEKLKNAIDILKKVLDLRVYSYDVPNPNDRFVISVDGLLEDAWGGSSERISGEQYELLKEVLGND